MPENSVIAMMDEMPLLAMLVTTSMSQMTAVCLPAHQWAQMGTAQSNSHNRGPQPADEPREAIVVLLHRKINWKTLPLLGMYCISTCCSKSIGPRVGETLSLMLCSHYSGETDLTKE